MTNVAATPNERGARYALQEEIAGLLEQEARAAEDRARAAAAATRDEPPGTSALSREAAADILLKEAHLKGQGMRDAARLVRTMKCDTQLNGDLQ